MRASPRRWYGASPWHLVLMAVTLAVIAYAGVRLLHGGDPWGIALWFVGAALLHDLVLVPAYTLVGRALRAVVGKGRRGRAGGARPAPGRVRAVLLDHVRVPAIASALLLLVYLPLILGPSDTYVTKSGLTGEPFAVRWLLVSAALFAVSALVGAVRAGRVARRARTT